MSESKTDRRQLKEKAKIFGNQLLKSTEGRVIANLPTLIPSIENEGIIDTLKVFWNTDKKCQPETDKIYEMVERVMQQLKVVNPELEKLVRLNDQEAESDDPTAYFMVMMLAALSHDSSSESKE